jgi:hypothetical protein
MLSNAGVAASITTISVSFTEAASIEVQSGGCSLSRNETFSPAPAAVTATICVIGDTLVIIGLSSGAETLL